LIEQLALAEVQAFIQEHLSEDPVSLSLKKSPFPNIAMRDLVEQIASRQKAKYKIPSWYAQEGILFPPAISMEQCSSERTARYKASLVRGTRMADLTGGFGVDTYFISQHFEYAVHVESNAYLHELVRHNFRVLGSHIVTLQQQAEKAIDELESQDLIYLDPARRDGNDQKVVFLEHYSPNVVEMLPQLMNRCEQLLLKVSPMLDIKKAVNDLGCVKEVHVVAVHNEVKELLFLMHKNGGNRVNIKAINLGAGLHENEVLEFTYEDEEQSDVVLGSIGPFLYEPNASILKAGAFKSCAQQFGLFKLHANTHLYTHHSEVKNFPGRVFRVKEEISLNKKQLKKCLPEYKANISVRNYPLSVKDIRKKTGLKDGGKHYIFALTDVEGKRVLLCEKVK
tara:strand:+ start:111678 stop:112862 length:1185 start_codon:yes stop_codon:yes gene_type:complete